MKSTDDKHNDNELKAYLDGRDGVSAAYRETARDEPSAALDAAILKAAREQGGGVVAKPQPDKRRIYALAASVMVGVVATSLYFRLPEDEETLATKLEQASVRTVELPLDQNAGVQTPAAEAQSDAPRQDFRIRELAPPAPTVGAESATVPPRDTDAIATDVQARAAASEAIIIDGPLLERIEAEAAEAQAQALRLEPEFEEITITGSRIRQPDAAEDVSYRASREEWLIEIRALSVELERRSRLAVANRSAATLTERLEQEMELFAEAYPDVDLDAELEE